MSNHLKKIKLWHKLSGLPAFYETVAFLDDNEIPLEEVAREDSIEEGYFITEKDFEFLVPYVVELAREGIGTESLYNDYANSIDDIMAELNKGKV